MIQIGRLLLNAGLEKGEFDALIPDAQAENAKNLRTYSLVALLVFGGLAAASAAIYDLTSVNRLHYIRMALVSLGIYLGARFLAPRRPRCLLPLCYLFMGALYAFSLALTAIHAELPSVTTIVLLFAIPFLVCDRPIRLVATTLAVAVALCGVTLRHKTDVVARMDLWNGLSFAVVAIGVELLQQKSKFRMLAQSRMIRRLSETDLLTGAKNRNHYENRRSDYAARCQANLVCVFVDANGLHELNNTEGHPAGDAMLQAVAHALIDRFGAEDTYRIGGDEFVCFRVDSPETQSRQDTAQIAAALADQGYSISAGIASADGPSPDMNALASAAEAEMYQAKRLYYQQRGRDRRRR